MSGRSLHTDWLNLIDISGPFLAEPVLNEAFPQGLEGLETEKKRLVRQAYDEWREALDLGDRDWPKIHRAWIDLVLKKVLELDENDTGDILKSDGDLPESLHLRSEPDAPFRPDYAVFDNRAQSRPLLLIVSCDADTNLTEATRDGGNVSSPADRLADLCRATGVRLGLLTNGEQWMLIDAPERATISRASWYARHWSQEPVTLQAFVGLLGVRRFFDDPTRQLPALLDNSLKFQDEVTDALGEQVARAVELLIQALDDADVDRDRELLEGIEPADLYEAGLAVMMRIVFLLCAEERGLLLLDDEIYQANYAVSTLREQLRAESEEILERRLDAWSRLLSIFRVVFAGVFHEDMRLPALGGSLFDPDRFPFLEGRKKGSHWKTDLATPLPIDNRTVLYLLEAVQVFQGRTLSYLALDIEQIGYVYEGLLERTVVRTQEVTLDLDATKNAKNPCISLPELDDAAANGPESLEALLTKRTGSSPTRVHNDLERPVGDIDAEKLLTACHGDEKLRNRIKPYFHLLRTDRWSYPLVYPRDAFRVAKGADRRETGTHYTPTSFTQAIVKETLEPLVYEGRAQGLPRENWQLKSPAAILDLKICDPAMGSGAFLVQACRWLAERLVEAWSLSEQGGSAITADGDVIEALGSREPLRPDAEDRLLTAKRLIAERCLYGVDMNPLAVELAKLSIWLVTLAKGRPFGFLDHNLGCGDSLLGVVRLDQLTYLQMEPGAGSKRMLFAAHIDKAVSQAIELRTELRNRPIRDIRDVELMAHLDGEARRTLELPELIADAFIGRVLSADGHRVDPTPLSIAVGAALIGDPEEIGRLKHEAQDDLGAGATEATKPVRAFHWPLEFPEVFSRPSPGFDALLGNPPFLGSQKISGIFGSNFKEYLAHYLTLGQVATADLVVFFFLRAFKLVREGGYLGLLARRSLAEGKNREIGLEPLLEAGLVIYSVDTNIPWPGKASVVVHRVHAMKGGWRGSIMLNGAVVTRIGAYLDDFEFGVPRQLLENSGRMFQGTILGGEGFKVDELTARRWIAEDKRNEDILYPFIGGNEVNSFATGRPRSWVINFWDWPERTAATYPRAFETVETAVKPIREKNKRTSRREKWWVYAETAVGLYRSIGRGGAFLSNTDNLDERASLSQVLVISRGVTKYPAFTFLPNVFVFSEKLYVIADDRHSLFCVLSSDIHAAWAWSQKTSMGGDLYSLSYTNGGIFETFPFPTGFLLRGNSQLEALGLRFFESRRTMMESSGKGLTKLYNDFHNPEVDSLPIAELRRIQGEMNEAVASLYGWSDLNLSVDFHPVGYLPTGDNIRFTIAEEVRFKVLRRLSKLNAQISAQQDRPDGVGANPTSSRISSLQDDLFT